MADKNQLLLALIEILTSESDEQHILTRNKILELLKSRYDIVIERRTLYNNIKTLQDFGYDINDYSENNIGYYLDSRQFEKSEINLLCHSIHSSHIIPDHSSNQLIDKLLSTQNKYVKSEFRNRVYSKNYRKSKNKEFFLNIDLLLEAIQQHKTICFEYTKYNHNKQRVPRREQQYHICPYDIVYINERCYLIGFNEKHQGLSHFRIDKMKTIAILEKKFTRIIDFNSYEYTSTKIYMYSGSELTITLRCDNKILDDVIDTFGTNIIILVEKNTFIAQISSSKDGLIFWALQYLKYCTVLEPTSLKNEILNIIEQAKEMYSK